MTEKTTVKRKAEDHSSEFTLINNLNDEIYCFPMKELIGSADSGMIIAYVMKTVWIRIKTTIGKGGGCGKSAVIS